MGKCLEAALPRGVVPRRPTEVVGVDRVREVSVRLSVEGGPWASAWKWPALVRAISREDLGRVIAGVRPGADAR